MIGNVKIYAPELKIKDYNRYRSIYCILCTYLSSSLGFMWRMFVDYDITFLLILLNTIATEKEKFYAKCPSRWSRKKIYASLNPSTMDYAVFITAFLIIIKTWKQTRCPSVGRWINSGTSIAIQYNITIVQYYSGVLFSAKKKWTIKPWKDMKEA